MWLYICTMYFVGLGWTHKAQSHLKTLSPISRIMRLVLKLYYYFSRNNFHIIKLHSSCSYSMHCTVCMIGILINQLINQHEYTV